MYWVRIDNRLIHGQVIETWLPYIRAKRLVVGNEKLADDAFQQQIMMLAIPSRIKVEFVHLSDLPACVAKSEAVGDRCLVLLATCQDARIAYDMGMEFVALNIGNLHYTSGKKQICSHIALADEDASQLRYLLQQGVSLDFRCVPNDQPHVKEWL